ncbi:hypothetical protein CHLRE_08g382476v5 [Chlamydomonas reinhardtii]|uniref:Uncharacterized protein n=1 Tax=Chlamydomonas reinhardtii TaxID=3055 RepID=A0A2K3DI55_CHLRE|nr:uncharacterized protein CHLRE_08g382476v5 [Chlamydomonas reinhardtii]PNW80206.1 hypothetical protein CHLRE_08g382476v5 [Chlamydomonas reinhardtii]
MELAARRSEAFGASCRAPRSSSNYRGASELVTGDQQRPGGGRAAGAGIRGAAAAASARHGAPAAWSLPSR